MKRSLKWNDLGKLNVLSLEFCRSAFSATRGCALAASVVGIVGGVQVFAQQPSNSSSQSLPTQIAYAKLDNAPGRGDDASAADSSKKDSSSSSKDAKDAASASKPALNPSLNVIDDREPVTGGASPVVETNGPLHTCDDGVSAALQQDAPTMPCWANIRTVDHWNSMLIPDGVSFHEAATREVPANMPSSFSYTAGGLSAFGLPDGQQAKVYGGLLAGVGLIEKERWQLMAEDAGGAGDFQLDGAHFAKMNRFAMRATGDLTDRWNWQGSATNTYATDALRLFAPLDYRMVGNSEAPSPDTVTYGLHTGEIVDQEEGAKLRFASSERTHWDFSGSDTYRHYTDDGFSEQTVRGRAEFLHAVTHNTAIGLFGDVAHQTNLLECSLGGGGVRVLSQWGSHASLNVSGAVNGASASCGNRVQFTGDAAFYYSLSTHTDLYVSGDRGLGDGAIERAVFLDTASAGVRHTFRRRVGVGLRGTALYGVDPNGVGGVRNQSLHGSFVEVSMRYPLSMGFSQESAFRHYAISGTGTEPDRSVGVFTLWWSPTKRQETASEQ